MAEVIVAQNADADLDRLVAFLIEEEPAAALATYDLLPAQATWLCMNTTRERTGL